MNAITQTYQVKDGKLIIDLPEEFKNTTVKVIIMPVSNDKREKPDLEELLQVSQWTEEDIKPILEAQKLTPNSETQTPTKPATYNYTPATAVVREDNAAALSSRTTAVAGV